MSDTVAEALEYFKETYPSGLARNFEATNIANGLFAIAREIGRLADAVDMTKLPHDEIASLAHSAPPPTRATDPT